MKKFNVRKVVGNALSVISILILAAITVDALSMTPAEVKSTVSEDTKYHAATVAMTPQEFADAGFQLGDSCDITFDSGLTLTDVPYFNGYYVKTGAPIIAAYPGFPNIGITYNNLGIWEQAGLTEGEGVTIRLNTAGKYSSVQEALGQVYSFDRADYPSDEVFCNFRPMSGGNLKENLFFRGASPADNSRGRAPYTDQLLEAHGIGQVLNLADSMDDVQGYQDREDYASDYFASLCAKENVSLLGLDSSYQSPKFQQKLGDGLRRMMQGERPVYIHCMEGKDRTGFVCMLLEALAGATYEQMRADYMMTYQNYYGVDPIQTPEKHKAISDLYFDAFAGCLLGTDAVELLWDSDYTGAAASYLRSCGLSDSEITQLQTFLTV